MRPELSLGSWSVSSYALTYAVAIVVAGMVALWRLDALGASRRRTLPAVAGVIVAGMLGSVLLWRLMAGVAAWLGRPDRFAADGSTILGVLLFSLPAAWLGFRLARLPVAAALDRVIVAVPLGQAIGRIGCLLAGCCAGRPTASWLALSLPEGHEHWRPRYPAQLIASVADLILFILLLALDRHLGAGHPGGRGRLRPGDLTALYFLLYGCKRFAMEFIRLNETVLGPLTWAHLLSALLVVAATIWLVLHRR